MIILSVLYFNANFYSRVFPQEGVSLAAGSHQEDGKNFEAVRKKDNSLKYYKSNRKAKAHSQEYKTYTKQFRKREKYFCYFWYLFNWK